jgi:tetratricopeptide (TPR) repeat protein
MFRKILNNNYSSQLLKNTIFHTKRSLHLSAPKKCGIDFWDETSEDNRKLIAMSESRPHNAEILMYKGHAQVDNGDFWEAIKSYQEAAKMNPSYKQQAARKIIETEGLLRNKRIKM